MKNIKIGPKLIASFLFIVAITTFMGIYLAVSLRHLNENNAVVYEKTVVPLGLLVQTADLVQEMRLQSRERRLAKSEEEAEAAMKIIDETHATLKELINQQKERVVMEAGKKPLDDLMAIVDKYVDEMRRHGSSNLGTDMRKACDAAIAFRINSAKKLSEEVSQGVSKDHTVAVVLLVTVGLISLFLGIYLTISVTDPLTKVMKAISEMEKGNMTARIGLERGDEFGILSKALDNLSAKLQTIFRDLRQDSDALASSSEELASIGKQVTKNAEENETNIGSVASASEQASTNTNTIAAAVEEMSASINQIASNAGEANKVATEATEKSREATGAMNKLGAAAKEIGQVTDVIKKIADMTNLLALNATIEAASAGAAGKGFAVVAGEIKELANQSAKSADDIARRIEGIQSGTGEAVTVINDVSGIIEKIGKSVESISNHVNQQTKASNEISRNTSEAAKGVSVMNQSVAGIAKGAKESSQGAQQINQSAGELARLASNLKGVLSEFRI